jgi:hypothetical protein
MRPATNIKSGKDYNFSMKINCILSFTLFTLNMCGENLEGGGAPDLG